MFGFDDVESSLQDLKIVVVGNGNQLKEYQTIMKNLSLNHMDGSIEMKVMKFDGSLILHQGPKKYHLHPVGHPGNDKGAAIAMINWEFPINEKFDKDTQYFVVFQAMIKTLNSGFTQKFASFFTEQEREAPPTISELT